MKIFVAYGYNDRDKWIPEQVFPLISAFGFEVETGEQTYDGDIPAVVKSKIRMSDGLMGFLTRRDPKNGKWTTHRWVTDELALASGHDKRLLEIRETDVDDQGGLVGNHQRIEYDEASRDKCLVDIAEALGVWNRSQPIKLRLNLKDVDSDQFEDMLDGLVCMYNIRLGNYVGDQQQAAIIPYDSGNFVDIPTHGPGTLVRIELKYGAEKWSSKYSPLDLCGVDLKKVP